MAYQPMQQSGKLNNNTYINIGATPEGHLETAIHDPNTAFGELAVAQLTPRVQLTFNYGINTDVVNTASNGTATVSGLENLAVLSTGASTNSSASMFSKKVVKYYNGQGSLCRFTSVFNSGVQGSHQHVGLLDDFDGYYFGYSGSSFGVFRNYNKTEYFTSQSDWNVDTMDGSAGILNPSSMSLDPTKGNVYQIKIQYLGFGNVGYFIEDSEESRFTLVHILKFANTYVSTSVKDPTLPVGMRVINTDNNTNIVLKSPSLAGFVEGNIVKTGPLNSTEVSQSGIQTETNIVSLYNTGSFKGVTNKVRIYLKSISATSDGNNGVCTVYIKKNPTFGTVLTKNSVSPNSVITVATGSSTISGGQTLYILGLPNRGSETSDLTLLDIDLAPNEVIAFTGKSTTTGGNTISVAANWIEDF